MTMIKIHTNDILVRALYENDSGGACQLSIMKALNIMHISYCVQPSVNQYPSKYVRLISERWKVTLHKIAENQSKKV